MLRSRRTCVQPAAVCDSRSREDAHSLIISEALGEKFGLVPEVLIRDVTSYPRATFQLSASLRPCRSSAASFILSLTRTAMANASEKASAEHQHQPPGECPHAVASTIIQRHRDNRQRFDSADYEMAQRASGRCTGCTCGKCAPTDGADLEQEPEPGSAEPREQLRCLRLQRFDSADWAMQTQRAQEAPQTDAPPTEPVNVAQVLMDRHALKTCALVGPAPVKADDQYADKA
ncbi:hypothetical protein PRNP1_009171 [Phytophthora ramorum]